MRLNFLNHLEAWSEQAKERSASVVVAKVTFIYVLPPPATPHLHIFQLFCCFVVSLICFFAPHILIVLGGSIEVDARELCETLHSDNSVELCTSRLALICLIHIERFRNN